MKKMMMAGAAVLMLAGCTATERGATAGALGGAAIGAAVDGKRGAAVGAGVGAIAGGVAGSGRDRGQLCTYRNRFGRLYRARCR